MLWSFLGVSTLIGKLKSKNAKMRTFSLKKYLILIRSGDNDNFHTYKHISDIIATK